MKEPPNCFTKWQYVLYSSQQWRRVLVAPPPCQYLVQSVFHHSRRHAAVSHDDFNLHFPQCLMMLSILSCVPSFMKCLRFFALELFGVFLFFFFKSFVCSLYILKYKSTIRYILFKHFLPFWWRENLPSRNFVVLDFTCHAPFWDLFFYTVQSVDWDSLFYMWIFTCFSTICWKICPFSIEFQQLDLCWISTDHICLGLFLYFLLWSIDRCVYAFTSSTLDYFLALTLLYNECQSQIV